MLWYISRYVFGIFENKINFRVMSVQIITLYRRISDKLDINDQH